MSFSPERLLAALEQCLGEARGREPVGLCLAFSGGLDSTVLLCSLVELRDRGALRLPLRALHVDHGLHPDSARWAQGCAHLAAEKSVPLTSFCADAGPGPGQSPEAAARDARYGEIRHRLAPGEILLTAHHADDQLETILLQWLRGGGLQAVAGMALMAPFGPGWHARPLLEFPRTALRAWADARRLAWHEDPSNLDPRYDRNYLRLSVLPALRARWPAAAVTAGRVAGFAADALALEQEVALADLAIAGRGATVALDRLVRLPAARQRALLRAWLRVQALPIPASRTLEALRHDMVAAAADRIPMARWPGAVVRRYRGRLYAESSTAAELATGDWSIAHSRAWPLAASARLELVPAVGSGLSQDRLPAQLTVAKRIEGAQFRAEGTAHRRPLRKWFQDHGVLPWRRDSIPLLCHDGEIIAIADVSCAGEYAARPGEPSWCIRWHGRPLVTEGEALAIKWREAPPFD